MLQSKLEACLLSLLNRADRQYFQFRQVLRPDPDKSGLTQLKEMSYLHEV